MGYCSHCKEDSLTVQCYTRKDGSRGRVEYCINHGCGYRKELSFMKWHDTNSGLFTKTKLWLKDLKAFNQGSLS